MTQWKWRNEKDAMKKTQWKRRNEKDAMMRRWSTCARQTLIVNFWISFVRNLSTRSPYIVYVEKRHQRSRLEKNHRIFILFGDVCEMRWDANLPCLVGNPIQSFFKQELQDKQWSKWCCDGDGLSLSLSLKWRLPSVAKDEWASSAANHNQKSNPQAWGKAQRVPNEKPNLTSCQESFVL